MVILCVIKLVRPKRDFSDELLTELKYHSACKLIRTRPDHFCTTKELAKNLKMSIRDVSKTLHQMVSENLLIHETVVHNSKLKHKFTPIDKRMIESKDLLKNMLRMIENHFEQLRIVSHKMRDRPALKDVKMIRITSLKQTKKIEEARSSQGKIDKKGMEYRDRFCEIVNQIFSFIDSMTYATYDGAIEKNEENDRVIVKLRVESIITITNLINYILKPLGARQAQANAEMIMHKIPTYYMILQMQRQAKIKI